TSSGRGPIATGYCVDHRAAFPARRDWAVLKPVAVWRIGRRRRSDESLRYDRLSVPFGGQLWVISGRYLWPLRCPTSRQQADISDSLLARCLSLFGIKNS